VTFYDFFETSFQKTYKVMFFEIWKNTKYVFSNTVIIIIINYHHRLLQETLWQFSRHCAQRARI